jgi:hypothetical protein
LRNRHFFHKYKKHLLMQYKLYLTNFHITFSFSELNYNSIKSSAIRIHINCPQILNHCLRNIDRKWNGNNKDVDQLNWHLLFQKRISFFIILVKSRFFMLQLCLIALNCISKKIELVVLHTFFQKLVDMLFFYLIYSLSGIQTQDSQILSRMLDVMVAKLFRHNFESHRSIGAVWLMGHTFEVFTSVSFFEISITFFC